MKPGIQNQRTSGQIEKEHHKTHKKTEREGHGLAVSSGLFLEFYSPDFMAVNKSVPDFWSP